MIICFKCSYLIKWIATINKFFYCEDGEYRVYCNICDELCIERYYKNPSKSRTHIKNILEREQLNKSFQVISHI